ncbi:hypothetical protein OV142_40845 [Nannocystis sp. SCPEA4]|nr:hypothetical protein [Nannocystis sp. SCPEA4]
MGLPRFYNCGGRSQVINTFFSLLEAHHAQPEDSYLSPDKLYALVDLDLGPERMPDGYVYATTEDVHAALYSNGLLNADLDSRHRIWTTALVHKEAFFVLPGIDRAWRTDSVPFLNGGPLVLRDVHVEAARRLEKDADLAGNFATLVARLKRFAVEGLDCSSPSGLGDSWLAAALRASTDGYELIVRALLAVAKIKPIWGQVEPDPGLNSSLSPEVYREQLVLKIGQEIARLDPARHSLTGFFSWLKQHR